MIEDNKIVQSIESRIGGKSGTYWRVTWQDDKADNIFNKDWLPLLEQSQKENRLLHFTKDKKEGSQYYNIVSLELADLPIAQPTHLEPSGELVVKPKPVIKLEMTKDDWSEKDRITRKSIERQVALKEAVALAAIKGIDDAPRVIATAKLFEAYLEGNPLVEEAKRLIKKGEEP